MWNIIFGILITVLLLTPILVIIAAITGAVAKSIERDETLDELKKMNQLTINKHMDYLKRNEL